MPSASVREAYKGWVQQAPQKNQAMMMFSPSTTSATYTSAASILNQGG